MSTSLASRQVRRFGKFPFTEGLAQNLHVLIEKPLAVGSYPRLKRMASLARKASTVTAVSFNWRYSPCCQTFWRAIQEGQIGRTDGYPHGVANAI